MIAIFTGTFAVVLGAEIVGDKTFYTVGAFATRYRLLPIFCGSTAAFMLKMLVAVWFGKALAGLPLWLVSTLNALAFVVMACVIWRGATAERDKSRESAFRSSPRTALAVFLSILFSEWGDAGQIAVAALAAHYEVLFLVWLAAVLATITKAFVAMLAGPGLRRILSVNVLRYISSGTCLAMGVASALRIA
jgi:putative Ca2+/H+ antiporter (TMEM165/GDT1 family)